MMKPEKGLYTAKAHTTGGREGGASRTDDGRLDVKPPTPGAPGTGTNPEQPFAAGWSACFLSAIKIAAGKRKVALPLAWPLTPKWAWAPRAAVTPWRPASTSACRASSSKPPGPCWARRSGCARTRTPPERRQNDEKTLTGTGSAWGDGGHPWPVWESRWGAHGWFRHRL